MGFLNRPFRVVWEGKYFRSGLTNVRAMVIKPNNVISGPYSLVEMPSPFLGRYYFDFISTLLDPEGEYFAMIVSPTDNLQDTLRIPLYIEPDIAPIISLLSGVIQPNVQGVVGDSGTLAVIIGCMDPVMAVVMDSEQVVGVVQDQASVSGFITDSTSQGIIQ